MLKPLAFGVWLLLGLAGMIEASPSFRRVVGPNVAVDNVDTFSSVVLALSTAPALLPDAVIQIEPGATPSAVTSTIFNPAAALNGFTIRGNPDFDASELPPLIFTNAVAVAGSNVRLENLNINFERESKLTVNGAGFVLAYNLIDDSSTGNGGIQLNGTSAEIRANRFRMVAGTTQIRVLGATNSTIKDNEFSISNTANHILYETAGVKSDLVEGNVFRSNRGISSTTQIYVNAGVTDVVFRNNTFFDDDFNAGAILMTYGVQNILIESNRIDYRGTLSAGAINVSGGSADQTTSFTARGNDISTGNSGPCMFLASTNSGTFTASIEGNRLRGTVGISVLSIGGSVTGIDLGGGSQGSRGGNDFRAFTTAATSTAGAIVAGVSGGSISALNNIFAGDPEQMVFDNGDDGGRANVDTSSPLTDNAAYVSSLYTRFLRRVADTQDTGEAGAIVASLDGANPTKVARIVTNLIRSTDALGLVIDDAYRSVLGRSATTEERQAAITLLTKKKKTEENLITSLYLTPEANQLHGSDRAFVVAVIGKLLKRFPTPAEMTNFSRFASRSRATVVRAILRTNEFKTLRVNLTFRDLLDRDATATEVKKLGAKDRLSLLITIAASPEYQTGS